MDNFSGLENAQSSKIEKAKRMFRSLELRNPENIGEIAKRAFLIQRDLAN